MQNIQKLAKKGIASLIGAAMLGALGLAVVPTANAASTCEADNWASLEGCLNQSNAGSVDTINVIDDIANTGWGHPSGEYTNLNVTNTVTIMGNGHTISYVHFHVTGGTFTLDNLKVNDGIENWPTYDSEIPVSITGATLNLTNGSGLYTNGGVGRAIGILVGNNSTLNLQSAGADWGSNYGGTQAIRAASGAIVTNNSKIGETSFDDSVAATVERVSNVKINITDGVYVNENSGTDNDTYAVNTWGADVTVGGNARVQEVYVKDGTYTQTAGQVTPDIDNSSIASGNASLTLDGSAKAYIEGGTLRTADLNSGARKSIHLLSADAKAYLRPQDPATPIVFGNGEVYGFKATEFQTPTNEKPYAFTTEYGHANLGSLTEDPNKPELRVFSGDVSSAESLAGQVANDANAQNVNNMSGQSASSLVVPNTNKLGGSTSSVRKDLVVYAKITFNDGKFVSAADGVTPTATLYGAPGAKNTYTYYDSSNNSGWTNPAGLPYNGDLTKPTDNGLFAGWYRDDKLEEPLTNFTGDPRFPFGYFVSKETQNVFVQRSAVNENGKFAIRVYSAVPNAHFNGFAFVNLTLYDPTQSLSKKFVVRTTTLYKTAPVNGSGTDALTPADYGKSGSDAKYWAVGTLTSIPGEWADSQVDVTPQWTTLDGTSVSRGIAGGSDYTLPTAESGVSAAKPLQ